MELYFTGYILVFGNSKIDALPEINDISSPLSWVNDFAGAISNTVSATSLVKVLFLFIVNMITLFILVMETPAGKGCI